MTAKGSPIRSAARHLAEPLLGRDAGAADVGKTVRERNRRLRELLESRTARALTRGNRDDLNALVALLEGDLLGRLKTDRHELYPLVDELIRKEGSATATMVLEQNAIELLVAEVAAAVERRRAATDRVERTAAKQHLRETLLRLDTLIPLHLSKGERVYLPLVEARLTAVERRRLLERLERASVSPSGDGVLDVRAIPHRARHDHIFAVYAGIPVGGALVLVNDHDPRPLSYQFAAEHPGTFTWEYLERGPTWRVRIGRVAAG